MAFSDFTLMNDDDRGKYDDDVADFTMPIQLGHYYTPVSWDQIMRENNPESNEIYEAIPVTSNEFYIDENDCVVPSFGFYTTASFTCISHNYFIKPPSLTEKNATGQNTLTTRSRLKRSFEEIATIDCGTPNDPSHFKSGIPNLDTCESTLEAPLAKRKCEAKIFVNDNGSDNVLLNQITSSDRQSTLPSFIKSSPLVPYNQFLASIEPRFDNDDSDANTNGQDEISQETEFYGSDFDVSSSSSPVSPIDEHTYPTFLHNKQHELAILPTLPYLFLDFHHTSHDVEPNHIIVWLVLSESKFHDPAIKSKDVVTQTKTLYEKICSTDNYDGASLSNQLMLSVFQLLHNTLEKYPIISWASKLKKRSWSRPYIEDLSRKIRRVAIAFELSINENIWTESHSLAIACQSHYIPTFIPIKEDDTGIREDITRLYCT